MSMRVGFVQFEPVFGQKERNIQRSLELIESVEADLLVLPELCTTGYLFLSRKEVESVAESIPDGPAVTAWGDCSARKGVYIVAGLAEKANGRLFNSAVLIDPEGRVEVYRKAHLFYQEKRWFEPGDTGFRVFDIGAARIGMMVCFDWIFPEVARILSLKGADILCHPANLVLPHCPDAMVTRCIENRVFAITSNRIGMEQRGDQKLTYIGTSEIVHPEGRILARADRVSEEIRVVEIHPEMARNKKITAHNPLFMDRRIELYDVLTEDMELG